jgi:signal transduction histidine kinase
MEKNPFWKLGFRLSTLPLLVIFIFLILSGSIFYFYGNLSSMKDSYKFYFHNLLSYKKSLIDQWFDTSIREIEALKNSEAFKEKVSIAAGEHPFIRSNKRLAEARQALIDLFEEIKSGGRYKSLSLLSKDGMVIVSSDNTLIGMDLSQKEIFKKIGLSDYLSTLSAFEYEEGLIFITAITDKKNKPVSFLYVLANTSDLLSMLNIEDSVYRSARLEILSGTGQVLMTKDGIAQKKTYNLVLRDNLTKGIDGDLLNVRSIKIPDAYLVSFISEIEAKGSFYLLFVVYLSLLCIVLLLLIFSVVRTRRLIFRPIEGFVESIKNIIFSDSDLNLEDSLKDEIKGLKETIKDMVEELKMRDSYITEKERMRVGSYLRSRFYSRFIEELKPLLPSIPAQKHSGNFDKKEVTVYSEGRIYPKGIVDSNLWLLQLSEDLSILYMLENKNLSVLAERFNLNDLIKEIEDFGKMLTTNKEVELIIDCEDSLKNSPLYNDKLLLKKIMMNLILNSLRYTKIGTITILFSGVTKHDKRYLEILLSDTGEGLELLDREELSLPFNLMVVKKLSNVLGGTMDIDSIKGRGTTIRVLISEDLKDLS